MKRLIFLAALLVGCGDQRAEDIDPVPAQSSESANRLMAEAQRAAGNAAARLDAVPQAEDNQMENAQ